MCFKCPVQEALCSKILELIWETFLYENNRYYDSQKLSFKFAFISFLSFHRNQKQKSTFEQVGGLITKKYFYCFYKASCNLLQRHSEFNRPLWKDFLTCYSCPHYCSMDKVKQYDSNIKKQINFHLTFGKNKLMFTIQ